MLLATVSTTYAQLDETFARKQIECIEKLTQQMNQLLTVYQAPQMPQFHISLTQNQASDQATTQKNEQFQETSSNLIQTNQHSQINIQQTLSNQLDACKGIIASIITYVGNNKIKCSCAGLATLYSYIAYQIYSRDQIMNAPTSWANWHNGCTFEEFMSFPASSSGSDLLQEVQTRYADPDNPTNFIYSLVEFTKTLQGDIKNAEELVTIYSWLDKAQCAHLFFIDSSVIAAAQAKLHKLLFIKHIFATWYASYKIEKNS